MRGCKRFLHVAALAILAAVGTAACFGDDDSSGPDFIGGHAIIDVKDESDNPIPFPAALVNFGQSAAQFEGNLAGRIVIVIKAGTYDVSILLPAAYTEAEGQENPISIDVAENDTTFVVFRAVPR